MVRASKFSLVRTHDEELTFPELRHSLPAERQFQRIDDNSPRPAAKSAEFPLCRATAMARKPRIAVSLFFGLLTVG
jgi:hypothetical protein